MPLIRFFSTVSVVGCGIMGSGIAQVIANNSIKVNLVGVESRFLEASKSRVEKSTLKIASKLYKDDSVNQNNFVRKTMDHICFTDSLDDAISSSDLIVEAVPENLNLKKELFGKIEKINSNCVMTTNTSSLSVREIFKSIGNKSLTAGLHFFNPVPIMRLVEVVQTDHTSTNVVEDLVKFVKKLNKVPIKCADTPGFVVNRLLIPYLADAISMLDEGKVSAQDIDEAMKLGAGHPMGPLMLCDYIGLDTMKFVLDGWSARFPDNKSFRCPKMLEKLVDEGKLGQKTGEGFYKH